MAEGERPKASHNRLSQQKLISHKGTSQGSAKYRDTSDELFKAVAKLPKLPLLENLLHSRAPRAKTQPFQIQKQLIEDCKKACPEVSGEICNVYSVHHGASDAQKNPALES